MSETDKTLAGESEGKKRSDLHITPAPTTETEPVRLVESASDLKEQAGEIVAAGNEQLLTGYVSAPYLRAIDDAPARKSEADGKGKDKYKPRACGDSKYKHQAAASRQQKKSKTDLSNWLLYYPASGKDLNKMLPCSKFGLVWAIMLSLFVNSIVSGSGARAGGDPGIAVNMFLDLPLQIYWSYCLWRLCQVLSGKYGRAPMTPWAVALLSMGAYLTRPHLVPYHDFMPFFFSHISFTSLLAAFLPAGLSGLAPLLWLLTQALWPVMFFSFWQKYEKPQGKINWPQICLIAAGANAYLLFSAPTQAGYMMFQLLWLVCQFWCIFYFAGKLRLPEPAPKDKKPSLKKQVLAGNDIVVGYRAFAALARWRKQQIRAMKQEIRTILWVAIPVMVLCYCLGLNLIVNGRPYLSRLLGSSHTSYLHTAAGDRNSTLTSQQPLTGPDTSTTAETWTAAKPQEPQRLPVFISTDSEDRMASLVFVSFLGWSGTGLLLLAVLLAYSQPTHLGLSPEGWRFLFRRPFQNKNSKYIRWKNVLRIYLRRPRGKTSAMDQCLCFLLKNGNVQMLKLDSLDSLEDREMLLKSIVKWASTASRDAEVIQALQPPSNQSYTELWLQALSAPPKRERLKPLSAGAVLRDGHYRVLYQLGAGGQGQAYLAEDQRQGGQIVLKEFILPVFVDGNVRRAALEKFENEARILRKLDHAQIVKLIDVFVEDHRAYLVLQHIKGESLREKVKTQGLLSESHVRSLLQQMCDILGYLHDLKPPVVHRDFTPDNLILDTDGRLMLIDFNVARQVVESTTSGTVVGKHAYLPPEQFRGMPECKSDIYALGATLHFLLTGHDPVPISMSSPKRLVETLSASINAIVEQATALDLPKRYDSIEQLKADLLNTASETKPAD